MTKMTSQKKLLALGAVITGGAAGYVYTQMANDDAKDGSKVTNEAEENIPPSKWTVNEPMLVGGKSSKDKNDVPDQSKKEDAVEYVNKEDAAETILRSYLNAVDTEESPEDGQINY